MKCVVDDCLVERHHSPASGGGDRMGCCMKGHLLAAWSVTPSCPEKAMRGLAERTMRFD